MRFNPVRCFFFVEFGPCRVLFVNDEIDRSLFTNVGFLTLGLRFKLNPTRQKVAFCPHLCVEGQYFWVHAFDYLDILWSF